MNSYPAPPNSNFIKKKGEKIQEGRLGQDPQKKYIQQKKKQQELPTDI
jgi:hypothetical protein